MVDTLALGASGSNPMEVQVLSSAPINSTVILESSSPCLPAGRSPAAHHKVSAQGGSALGGQVLSPRHTKKDPSQGVFLDITP